MSSLSVLFLVSRSNCFVMVLFQGVALGFSTR